MVFLIFPYLLYLYNDWDNQSMDLFIILISFKKYMNYKSFFEYIYIFNL